ncbi:MFS multidrug transporter [Seiridium cupressi]
MDTSHTDLEVKPEKTIAADHTEPAVPQITDEFHSLSDIGWYGSAYQLGSAAFGPLSGNIFHHFNLKWAYLVFFAIFEIGSAICGVAQSSAMLIVGRVIAGVSSGAYTILSATVPLERCPVPLLLLHIPDQIQKSNPLKVVRGIHHHLDLIGFALLAPAIVQLLLSLQFGANQFSWSSSQVVGLFCGSGATFIIWVFWNIHEGDKALLPFSIIKREEPNTSTGEWVGFLIIAGLGRGASLQMPLIAIQSAVTPEEMSPAMAFTVWCQYTGPTIFLTLYNTIFDTSLRSQIPKYASNVDAQAVIAAGATRFRSLTFYLQAGAGVVAWVSAWGMGWKDIRKKKDTALDQPTESSATTQHEDGKGNS